VHANASLFKAPEIKRAVQGGQAQAGEILMVNFQNEWGVWGADGIPFMATSYDDAMKLWNVQRPLVEKKLAEQGMMALYAVPWPPQGIYSKKPLSSAADLKGIKWRAYSPSTSRIAELVGAQPVTVQAAEVSQAFATGVTESMMSSGSTGADAKLHEHVKYWYDTQAWLPKNLVIVNRAAFNALDKATQDAVVKAAADAEGDDRHRVLRRLVHGEGDVGRAFAEQHQLGRCGGVGRLVAAMLLAHGCGAAAARAEMGLQGLQQGRWHQALGLHPQQR
jgi:TRAP-type C4-dicarboxylate transport system substrate-binding protein